MSMMSEFKEFAVKGNVIDLAVGLIIGAEFGKIVNSLVTDVIMPPIGLIIGYRSKCVGILKSSFQQSLLKMII